MINIGKNSSGGIKDCFPFNPACIQKIKVIPHLTASLQSYKLEENKGVVESGVFSAFENNRKGCFFIVDRMQYMKLESFCHIFIKGCCLG